MPTFTLAAASALVLAGSSGAIRGSRARVADSPPPAAAYTLVDLGAVAPFDTSEARAINDQGVVVGQTARDQNCSTQGCDDKAAVEWHIDANGIATATILPGLGSGNSIAFGINHAGDVAGQSENLPVAWHDGVATNLASVFPDPVVGYAFGINDGGEVVGGVESAPQVAGTVGRAVAWAPTTFAPTVLQDLSGGRFGASADAVNDLGQIVGSAGSVFGTRAFSTPGADQPMSDLLGMGPVNNAKFALSLNNNGEVVGYVSGHGPGGFTSGGYRATVFRNGSADPPADLGTLDVPDAGNSSWANAVNDSGQIVGVSYVGNDGYEHATLWDANGAIHDLNDLVPPSSPLFLDEATAINNDGWIVGWGYPQPRDDSSSNGVYHAFLLIPNTQIELKGLEVTQALQDLHNSVALTEGKTTYVRAYLDWTGSGRRETGGLLYGTRNGSPLPGSPLHPLNGTIEATSGALARRGTWDDSLDFLLPTSWASGTVDLEFKLPADDKTTLACEEAADVPNDCQAAVQFQPVGQLQVRLVQVAASFPAGTAGIDPTDRYTPSFADILRQVDTLRALLPSASIDWTSGALAVDFTDRAAGGGHPLFDELNLALQYAQELDGCIRNACARIDVGLMRGGGGPTGLGVGGESNYIPGETAAVLMDPNPLGPGRSMVAHEVAHDLGLIHDVSATLPAYVYIEAADPIVGLPETRTTPHDSYGDPGRQGPCGELAFADIGEPRSVDYPYFAPIPGTVNWLFDGVGGQMSPGFRPVFGPIDTSSDNLVYAIDSGLVDSNPGQAVFAPTQAFDLMSYCPSTNVNVPNGWAAGKPTYLALRDALNARFPAPAPVARRLSRRTRALGEPTAYLAVRGMVDIASNTVHFMPFGTLTAPEQAPPASGGYTARLVDARGNVIAQSPFDVSVGHTDVAPGSTAPARPTEAAFLTLLPMSVNAAAVEIVDDAGAVIGSVSASTHSPTVTLTAPSDGTTLPDSGAVARWQEADADGDPLSSVVQYSSDGGTTWSTLAVDLRDDHFAIDTAQLAGSSNARIRVTVSDGFHTASATTGRLVVPNHAPLVAIGSPGEGAAYTSDQAIALTADAYDVEDGPLAGTAIRWTVDGTAAGSGPDAVVEASGLAPGGHTVIATATDSAGVMTTVARHISVGSARDAGTFPTAAVGGQAETAAAPTAPPPSTPPSATAPTPPTLSVETSATPTTPGAGAPFTIKTVVANGNTGTATGVVSSETVPAGVTIAAVSASQGTCTATTAVISCSIGTLQEGVAATVTITAIAAKPGTYRWTATVADGNGGRHDVTLDVTAHRSLPPQLTLPADRFAPPLQARRVGKAAVLTTTVDVDEPVTLSMSVSASHPLSLLRGSSLGASATSSPVRVVSGFVAAGAVRLHLRLRRSDLKTRATYRIRLVAVDGQQLRSTLIVPFTSG